MGPGRRSSVGRPVKVWTRFCGTGKPGPTVLIKHCVAGRDHPTPGPPGHLPGIPCPRAQIGSTWRVGGGRETRGIMPTVQMRKLRLRRGTGPVRGSTGTGVLAADPFVALSCSLPVPNGPLNCRHRPSQPGNLLLSSQLLGSGVHSVQTLLILIPPARPGPPPQPPSSPAPYLSRAQCLLPSESLQASPSPTPGQPWGSHRTSGPKQTRPWPSSGLAPLSLRDLQCHLCPRGQNPTWLSQSFAARPVQPASLLTAWTPRAGLAALLLCTMPLPVLVPLLRAPPHNSAAHPPIPVEQGPELSLGATSSSAAHSGPCRPPA